MHLCASQEGPASFGAHAGSPVQLDARLLLQLRPHLVGLVHHGNVEVLLVGLADDPGLAVGAPPGVGQQKLDQDGDVWGQFWATGAC